MVAARRSRVATREQETADTWTLTLEPVDGDGPVDRARAVHDGLRLRRRRGADLGQRRRDRAGAGRPHRARRRRGHARRSARPSPARCSACAARSGPPGRSTRPRAATSSSSPAASASRRCGRSSCTRSSAAASYGEARAPLRRAHARPTSSTATQLEELARDDRRRRHRRRRRRRLARARSASCRSSSPTAPLRPGVGDGVRLRPRDHDALRGRRRCSTRGVAPERIYVSLERNMQCGVGHCGHCQLGPDAHLPRRPGLPVRPRRAVAGGAGAVSAAQAEARGLEVRLLRRLPAHAARLRGRAARARRRGRDRLLPRGDERHRRGAVRPLARRGLDHDAARRRADPARCGAASKALVTIGACATAGGIQALRNFADVDEFVARRLRVARVHLDARDLDADRGARPRRLRAARLPDRQAPAARGRHRVPARPQARDPVAQRLHRVQAPRHRLRDGRARHAVPRAGDARRLRRALPGLRPRLLRLLRPDGDAEHRLARRGSSTVLGMGERGVERVFRTFNADAPELPRGERRVAERRTIRTDYLARVEGEGAMSVRLAGRRASSTSSSGSSSRRASSRRSCAAARSARRPTSRRASAASARSPTR